MKKLVVSMAAILVLWAQAFGNVAFADSAQQLTPGIKLIKRSTTVSDKKQAVNIVDINLLDPYTKVEYGISSPINKTAPVTTLSKLNTYENHHVVGAVNASLFHMDNGYPSYLLSQNNKIENLGAVSSQYNDFMYVPAAFGVNKNGQGLIDKFNLNISVTHHGRTFQLDSFNRQRNSNESILYTSSFRFDNTRTNDTGLEIVVTNLDKKLDPGASFGDTVTGTVTGIRPYGQYTSATIPANGFVISAQGIKVDQVRDLKLGDPVSIKIDVEDKWKDAKFMLASGPLLVQGGQVNMTIDPASPRATSRTARTAVAIDATGNKVFLVTVDGRQPGYSEGMTLKEFANYLVSQGAYQAINLDGGGSTTLAARIPGNRYASLINKPQDGTQRYVSSILQAISIAPYGPAVSFKATQATPGKIAVGGAVGFTITDALDGYNNLIPFDQSKVELLADGVIGKIEDNKFVGLQAGTTNVTVKYGNAQVQVPMTVVTSPSKFEITPKELYIGKNETQKLALTALDAEGKPVIYNSSTVVWSQTGNVGTIDPNGTFHSAATDATGTVSATLGSSTYTIPVKVSNQPRLMNGFENATDWKAESIRAKTTVAYYTDQAPREGKGILKLNYDFTGNTAGTAASYAVATNRIALPGKPVALGLWVYGDGRNHWLRSRLLDAAGKELTVNFTVDGGLNWVGWKYVQALIPATATYPLSLDRIYVTEPNVSKMNKGVVYFDKLQTLYELPYQEQYFAVDSKTIQVDSNKTWTVAFNIPLNPLTVNNKNIYVQDVQGNRIPVNVKVGADSKTVVVEAPTTLYTSGTGYQIVVTEGVQSALGAPVKKDFYWTYKIK